MARASRSVYAEIEHTHQKSNLLGDLKALGLWFVHHGLCDDAEKIRALEEQILDLQVA